MSIAEKLITIAENEQKVYDAGKQAEAKRFWTTYQQSGNRTYCAHMFGGSGWNNTTFRPMYDIKPKDSAYMMFRDSAMTDIYGRLEELGLTLDFSNCQNMQYALNQGNITRIGTVSIVSATNLDYAFYAASKVTTIDKLIVKDNGATSFSSTMFGAMNALKEIRFEGTIGRSITFPNSPLSVASMVDIINHLANYYGTSNEGKYKVTFTSACWTALEATTPPEGFDTWKQYVSSLGWTF